MTDEPQTTDDAGTPGQYCPTMFCGWMWDAVGHQWTCIEQNTPPSSHYGYLCNEPSKRGRFNGDVQCAPCIQTTGART